MIRLTNFRISVDENTDLTKKVAQRLKQPIKSIKEIIVVRRAIDARRKNNISFVYTLLIKTVVPEGQVISSLSADKDVELFTMPKAEELAFGSKKLNSSPVVIGAGPAGLIAALYLAKNGYKPLLLERGKSVQARTQDVEKFWQTGEFNAESNVQFGEGGAGTFSDGKLTTRITDARMQEILSIFVAAGAPKEIKYQHKPHVGTDILKEVVCKIREEIIRLGGTVKFEAKVTDFKIVAGKVQGITINNSEYIPTDVVMLGIGHSARDTYERLYDLGVSMEAKPFSIGVRIEHPQEMIDRAQYGVLAGSEVLGAADYALVYHDKVLNRTAYSFCMCPGGLVIASSSEAGGVVTNGMSNHARNSGIANSAIVVNINPEDYGNHVLDGINFQRQYERLAFKLGGNNYQAPAQTVGNFLKGQAGNLKGLLTPSYKPGVKAINLHECLPSYVGQTLAKALPYFGNKIRGFDHAGAIMTGVETRTSAPIRVIRNDEYTSINTSGLYPIGEGAGYAGGIMSAALDGANSAIALMKKYSKI